ncbi:MAG TPA: glucokinase [Rugosibacter sp.]
MILGGDIGGTKVLLGLAENGVLIIERRYASADFSNFTDLLAAFFTDTQLNPSQVHGGCLAVAGPIADDGSSVRLTNLPWIIDCAELSRRLGLPSLQLVNDFAAAALGAVTATSDQQVTLQAGQPLPDAPRLVVGAGTGLGMALVLPHASSQNQGWHIVPSEGGHAAFAPADEEQLRLWQFLHARHGRVIWEHVVSGPGITAIHECMTEDTLSAKEISLLALANANSPAHHSMELFLAAYGAFAGDMALACLARGGVFLAGGIITKLLPLLPHSPFLMAFNAKAEHAAIAAKMSIHVATDPALGLNGALRMAQKN